MQNDLRIAVAERRLVRRILASAADVPAPLEAAALRHIIDFVGVALAGMSAAPVGLAAALHAPAQPGGKPGRLLGSGRRMGQDDAVLVNAMAGHIHDFDDDEVLLSIAHTTVPVMAAAWTVGEAQGVSGKRLIAAYVCGVEIMMRLGQMINPDHYRHGWHSTATLGVFGAAVASAIVLGASEEELLHALYFAASMPAGLRASFGSDGKALQVARAARNGVQAVRMAMGGLRCAAGVLFGPQGFVHVYGGATDRVEPAIDAFCAPSGLVDPGLTIKAYPCCTATHTAIDAVLSLMAQHDLQWREIVSLDVLMGQDLPAILIYDRPSSGLEGKFSMRYCAAAAARFGQVGIAEFENGALLAPGLDDLMDRTQVRVDFLTPRPSTGLADHASVSIAMKDGRVLDCRFEAPTGSMQRPFSEAQLREKFLKCAAPALGQDAAEAAHASLMSLPSQTSLSSIANALISHADPDTSLPTTARNSP